ncbi:hypothetical protein D3C80_1995890 [compost metagenome]
MNGTFNSTPGTFTPLRFPKIPPTIILQVTPSSSTERTSNFINPSSNKTMFPTERSFNAFL